jgi:hypothetical protein
VGIANPVTCFRAERGDQKRHTESRINASGDSENCVFESLCFELIADECGEQAHRHRWVEREIDLGNFVNHGLDI